MRFSSQPVFYEILVLLVSAWSNLSWLGDRRKKFAPEIAGMSLAELLNEPLEMREVKEEVILAFEEVLVLIWYQRVARRAIDFLT